MVTIQKQINNTKCLKMWMSASRYCSWAMWTRLLSDSRTNTIVVLCQTATSTSCRREDFLLRTWTWEITERTSVELKCPVTATSKCAPSPSTSSVSIFVFWSTIFVVIFTLSSFLRVIVYAVGKHMFQARVRCQQIEISIQCIVRLD